MLSRRFWLMAAGLMALVLIVVIGATALSLALGSNKKSSTPASTALGNAATPVASATAVETPAASGKGYLALTVTLDRLNSALRVASVEANGPAANAGLQVGDLLRSVDGAIVRTPEALRSAVEARAPGTTVSITYERGDRELQASVKLADEPPDAAIEPPPASVAPPRPRLGVQIAQITPDVMQNFNLSRDSGVVITGITQNTPAAAAGLQTGDIILAVDGMVIDTVETLQKTILAAPANQAIDLGIQRGDQQMQLKIALPAAAGLGDLASVLPQALRDRLQQMIDNGTIAPEQLQQLLRLYQVRGDNVRYGKVTAVAPDALTIAPAVGGDPVSVRLTATTALQRAGAVIQAADVMTGDNVLVLSMDGGQTAFAVYDVGAAQ